MNLEEAKKLKKKLGYSNVQLSEDSGVALGTLNKILSGETKNPSYENWKAIEATLTNPKGRYGYFLSEDASVKEEIAYQTAELPGAEGKHYVSYLSDGSYVARNGEEIFGYEFGPYTVEDYRKLPDDRRAELIDGYFYDMAAPTIVHQRIIAFFYRQFSNYIEKKGGKCEAFMSPIDVKLNALDQGQYGKIRAEKTMVQPDFFVICNPDQVTDQCIIGAPDFVLEVVSPSTGRNDYGLKLDKYRRAGVKEYWIVDPIRQRILVYDFTEEGIPVIYGLEGACGVGIYQSELEIDLGELLQIITG